MATNSFAALKKKWVTPVLVDAGFVKERLDYRLETERGTVFVHTLLRNAVEGFQSFIVDASVEPVVSEAWELRRRSDGERQPTKTYAGMWMLRLHPSPSTVDSVRALIPVSLREVAVPSVNPMWMLPDEGDSGICGRDLRDQLERIVPDLVRLLDPDRLLAEIRADEKRSAHLTMGRSWAEALLLSTRGSSDELDAAIEQIDRANPSAEEFITWVRSWELQVVSNHRLTRPDSGYVGLRCDP